MCEREDRLNHCIAGIGTNLWRLFLTSGFAVPYSMN